MKNKTRVYVASPFFNDRERRLLDDIKKIMTDREEIELYFPMSYKVPNGEDMPNHMWGLEVFQHDMEEIKKADEVWVISHGMYGDTGTAWECGFAYGIGKVVRVIYLDTTQSLMMMNGCDDVYKLRETYDELEGILLEASDDISDLIQK